MVAHMKCYILERPIGHTIIAARTIATKSCGWIKNRRFGYVPTVKVSKLVPVRVATRVVA